MEKISQAKHGGNMLEKCLVFDQKIVVDKAVARQPQNAARDSCKEIPESTVARD